MMRSTKNVTCGAMVLGGTGRNREGQEGHRKKQEETMVSSSKEERKKQGRTGRTQERTVRNSPARVQCWEVCKQGV